MNVSINPECQKFIDEQVRAGKFSSSSEALEAGIARLMLDSDADVLDEQDAADVRESLDQIGRGDTIDATSIHTEIRRRVDTK